MRLASDQELIDRLKYHQNQMHETFELLEKKGFTAYSETGLKLVRGKTWDIVEMRNFETGVVLK